MNWKAGDKCLYDFNEGEILKVEDGNVYCVHHSCFEVSGNLTDRCFPVTEKGRVISNLFAEKYGRLHDLLPGQANFPDFNRHAVSKWCQAMENHREADAICQEFTKWCDQVIDVFDKMKMVYIDGVKLMR